MDGAVIAPERRHEAVVGNPTDTPLFERKHEMGVNGATDTVTNANPPPRNPDTDSSKEAKEFKETVDRETTSNDSSKQSQGTSNSYPIILATRPPINLAHSTGNQGAPSQAAAAAAAAAPAAAKKAPTTQTVPGTSTPLPSQPPPAENRLPDDVPEPTTLPPGNPDPTVPRFEKKNPQPTVYNSGPTQTAFVPGDVGAYADRNPPPFGSLATEINGFVLGGSQGGKPVVTSYAQVAVRGRTSADVEQGFIGTAGGQTGSGTAILSAGYQLHQGTILDTRENAPSQSGQGNWFSLSLASTPQENPRTPATNLTGNYVRAYSRSDGNTAVDVNVGANFAARGSVSGRDVWGSLNPYAGANVSHQFGSVSLNVEGVVGPNLGYTLVNPGQGDPGHPWDVKASFGVGLQKQVGEKQDYTLGVEALGTIEAHSNIPGPAPWTAGVAFTLSAY